jgi:hypothetical protein
MNLTSQQLSNIIAGLRSSRLQAGDGGDKRQYARMAVQAKVDIEAIAAADLPRRYSALTRDISFGGVGLTQSLGVDRGRQFVIHLPCESKACVLLLCSVMHCRVLAHSLFAIGAEFTGQVAEDFVSRLAKADERETQRIRDSILGAGPGGGGGERDSRKDQ